MRSISTARGWDIAAAAAAFGLALSEVVGLTIRGIGSGGIGSGGVGSGGIGSGGIGSGGQTMAMTIIGSSAFVAVLAVAAIGVALHRQVGWIFGLLGVLTAASYGILLATMGSAVGTVYVAGAVALFVFVVKSLHWYRSEQRNEIVAT
jgi:hypothetical protein